jgi:hypothetical protein
VERVDGTQGGDADGYSGEWGVGVIGFGAVAKAYALTCCIVALGLFVLALDGSVRISDVLTDLPFLLMILILPTLLFALPGFGLVRAALYLANRTSALSFAVGGAFAGLVLLVLLRVGPLSGFAVMRRNLAAMSGPTTDQSFNGPTAQGMAALVAFLIFCAVMALIYHRLERWFSGGVTFVNRPAGPIPALESAVTLPRTMKYSDGPVLWWGALIVGFCCAAAVVLIWQQWRFLAKFGAEMARADWYVSVIRPYYYSIFYLLPGFVVAYGVFFIAGFERIWSRIGMGLVAQLTAFVIVNADPIWRLGGRIDWPWSQLLGTGVVFGVAFWMVERTARSLFGKRPPSAMVATALSVAMPK